MSPRHIEHCIPHNPPYSGVRDNLGGLLLAAIRDDFLVAILLIIFQIGAIACHVTICLYTYINSLSLTRYIVDDTTLLEDGKLRKSAS